MLLSITLIRMLGLLLDSLCQKAKLPSLPGMLAAVFAVSASVCYNLLKEPHERKFDENRVRIGMIVMDIPKRNRWR